MIDLIDECSSDLADMGYTIFKDKKYGIEIGKLCVDTPKKAQDLGFRQGQYVIINSPLTYLLDDECCDFVSTLLAREFKEILGQLNLTCRSKYFVVGIGNPDILADSLGKKVVDKVEIDAFDDDNQIFKLCPNINLNTGLATYDIVSILAKALEIDCIILIDSLATNNIDRLGISFQLNSAGLTPGSANIKGKRIDISSTGIKCVSFGVPFMIFASSLCDTQNKDLILAPKDIHENVDIASSIIANAINMTLRGTRR